MKKLILTETQLKSLSKIIKEGDDKVTSDKTKQRLFTIAVLAHKMWEEMGNGEELDEWMVSKILQTEQNIISITKSYLYGDTDSDLKGMDTLNYDDLVIGI